jgi:hypothetical protein
MNADIEHVDAMLIFTVVAPDVRAGPLGLDYNGDTVELGVSGMKDVS